MEPRGLIVVDVRLFGQMFYVQFNDNNVDSCGGSETPCNITRYYAMIVHCMISVLFQYISSPILEYN